MVHNFLFNMTQFSKIYLTAATTILLTVYYLTQRFCSNFTHNIWFNSAHHFLFNLTQLFDLIWQTCTHFTHIFWFDSAITNKLWWGVSIQFDLFYYFIWIQLQPFDSPFLIWIIFTDSIWPIFFDSIRLNYLILFDTDCTH